MFVKEEIINSFPSLKLSYEKIIHNKVYSFDFIMSIPCGKKCFAWFTLTKEGQNVCYLLETDNKKQINNVQEHKYAPYKQINICKCYISFCVKRFHKK